MDARLSLTITIVNAPNQIHRMNVFANNVGQLKSFILEHADQLGLNSNFPRNKIKVLFEGSEKNDDGYIFSTNLNLYGSICIMLPPQIEKQYKAGYVEPPPLPPRKPKK